MPHYRIPILDPVLVSLPKSFHTASLLSGLFPCPISQAKPSRSYVPRNNPHLGGKENRHLRIRALAKRIAALAIVRDERTVLRARLVAADRADDDAVRAGAAAIVGAGGQDGEFQVGRGAAEVEALVVLVLVRVAVFADGLAVGVVVEGGRGGIVDVLLAVGRSWRAGLERREGEEGRKGGGTNHRSWSCSARQRSGPWRRRRRGAREMR